MYYYLNGELAYLDTNLCVIDCGGVGYKLTVSLVTASALTSKVGTKVKLYTHMSVREDGVELFGFGTDEERSAYNMLTGVSGVGPKAAMGVLSYLTPDKLALAIATDDIKTLSKAPNIGKKTAARIILELKDKMAGTLTGSPDTIGISISVPDTALGGNLADAGEALMLLGYDKTSISSALKGLDPTLDAGSLIKLALKKLAR